MLSKAHDSCTFFVDYFFSIFENNLNFTAELSCSDNIDSALNINDLDLPLSNIFTSIGKLRITKKFDHDRLSTFLFYFAM